MSSIASLFNVPGTEPELETWSFAHAAHHRDVNRILYQIFKVVLPEYVLDPFNPKDQDNFQNWLYQHQNIHQATDAILGVSGFDLTDVDWSKDNERAGWIYLNSNEHFQWANLLELG